MRLYFARHGESEANRLRIISNRDLPHPLTEAGRRQVALLAEQLRGKPIARIHASPILRAHQTGGILAATLSVPLEVTEALREPDTGIWEGRGDEEAWTAVNGWVEAWLSGRDLDQGPEDGETYIGVRGRMGEFIQGLVREHGTSQDEFVLVTHGAAMLFSLPGLVEGVEAKAMREHGPGYAEFLCAEVRQGKLVLGKGE